MPVTLDVIVTAEAPMPEGYALRVPGGPLQRFGGLRSKALPSKCLAFVVGHPAIGPVVVDTGLHLDALTDLSSDFGRAMGLMFRSLRPAGEAFDAQLRAAGVEAADVQRVVMTHLHVDHTSAMRLLPAARFTCARAEWEAAHARFAVGKGYVGAHLPDLRHMDLVDVARDGEPFGPFLRTLDLLGDGSIRLVSTPGHTAGHLSVLLDDVGGRSVLLVGDAAYTRRSIDEQRLPMLTDDDGASRASLRELAAFAMASPEALLVPTHDPEAGREV